MYFQSLRDDESEGQIPVALPDFDARHEMPGFLLGGDLGVFASSAGASANCRTICGHTSSKGSARVLQSRCCFRSEGNLPSLMYFPAALRPIPAFSAAISIVPCLPYSSINFLTCASVHRKGSPPLVGEHGAY